jgi:hypothetical protein
MKVPAILFLAFALAPLACVEKPSKQEEIAEALANRSAQPRKAPMPMPVPGSTPLLAVLAGQGAGPIRLGANVAQVERLMQHPCETRSENLCRYATRGIDFNLVGGLTQSIYIQRSGRPAGKDADGNDIEFGFFYGMIPPDLRLGMLPEAVQEYLGKPRRAERVAGPNPQNTVYRHEYPGMTLEYDYWPETKRLILGGIRVFKDPSVVTPDAGATPDAGLALPSLDAGAVRLREPEPR